MNAKSLLIAALPCFLLAGTPTSTAGERTVVTLRDFCGSELRYTGIELAAPTTVHIKALGGGGDHGWTYKSDRLFAYGWIINAETREPVWTMTASNSSKSGDDREFEGSVRLDAGRYEAYFTAYGFAFHTTFSHIVTNVDHRMKPLFGESLQKSKGASGWFKSWWSDDIADAWKERCAGWGMELLVDESMASRVSTYELPGKRPTCVIAVTGIGDNALVRRALKVSKPTNVEIRAIGEGRSGEEIHDYGWIVDARDRSRVWDMTRTGLRSAGGAQKNALARDRLTLETGEYVLYYVTDGSHSTDDWNDAPPYDPLSWGITVCVDDPADRGNITEVSYTEISNPIVRLVKVGDNENRSQGFALAKDATVRVYAFGERSNARRQMADYGTILDARTRARVWEMNVDRSLPGGGASKNRLADEIIDLPKGSYIVTFTTDDSHAYGTWNDDPPFDRENYGITVMGAGADFSRSIVAPYTEERDNSIIAQIVRPGDNADRSQRFSLKRTTRVRLYGIGEGQNREMFDYGWIENARTGAVVWEMTYAMTMHAGGGRKNRSVNTTILLESGDYLLRFKSDDSHSFGDWNVTPPDDQQYWGITVYREDAPASSAAPISPAPPPPPKPGS